MNSWTRTLAACSVLAVSGIAFATSTVNTTGVATDYADDPRECCAKLGRQPEYRLSSSIRKTCQDQDMRYVEGSARLSGSSYCAPHGAPSGSGYKVECTQGVIGQCVTKQ